MNNRYILAILVGSICFFLSSLIIDRVWVTDEIRTYRELIFDTIQMNSILIVVIFIIKKIKKTLNIKLESNFGHYH